jgi:hypothetical protein
LNAALGEVGLGYVKGSHFSWKLSLVPLFAAWEPKQLDEPEIIAGGRLDVARVLINAGTFRA